MASLKTFEGLDPLIAKQKEDVAKMRTSLLACTNNPKLASAAFKQVTVLKVYHQMIRIIRYTEMCDKIENRLYGMIDNVLQTSGDSIFELRRLLDIQERLQKLIIESNKILAPYLNMTEYIETVESENSEDGASYKTIDLDATKRERLRNSAQQVLAELNKAM